MTPLQVLAQTGFFGVPARVIGQTTVAQRSPAPNLVEGRELYQPQAVALDTTVSPPIVYVCDTGNNRILAWRDALGFSNGAMADLVIGQTDMVTTSANGPGVETGLNSPTGLAVDLKADSPSRGYLYVLDSGNNRVLRFPRPFEQTDNPRRPDAAIGQPNLITRTANTGGISSRTLNLLRGGAALRGSLMLDSAGNLYVTDSGNNRVLRYPVSRLGVPAQQQPEADTAWGQPDFTTNTATTTINELNRMNSPSGLAMDNAGRLYVSDDIHRVLVFVPGFLTGQTATRVIGGLIAAGRAINPPTDKSLNTPQGVAVAGNDILVMDFLNNRILRFDSFAQWPASEPPSAREVIGQADFAGFTARKGADGLAGPVKAVFSGSELFVADASNHRVVVFPYPGKTATRVLGQLGLEYNGINLVEGRELSLFGGVGATSLPVGGNLTVDINSNPPRLYIADTFNHRVLGYCDARKAKQGDFADVVVGQPTLLHSSANYNSNGSTSANDTNLSLPVGVAVDTQGSLFVSDFGNGRVLRFPAPCAQAAGTTHRANLVIGQFDFTSRSIDPSARVIGEPYGLAFMPEGHLLVSDRAYNRVLLFKKPDGGDFNSGMSASAVFGQPDFNSSGAVTGNSAPPNRMSDPRHIATDSSGRLYVTDYRNNRFLVFGEVSTATADSTAALVVTNTTGNTRLNNPHGIYVSRDTGEIWVTALNVNSVFRYPEFGVLSFNPSANGSVGTATQGVGLTMDGSGKLFTAEAGNRVALYVPSMVVSSSANFQQTPLAPGMIATVWGSFANVDPESAAAVPLPRTLRDLQVLVNDSPVPLFYAGSGIINFQVPMSAPSAGSITLLVTRASTQEVLAAVSSMMRVASPAPFVRLGIAPFSQSQIAAQNTNDPPGQVTCNGPDGPPIPIFCPGGTRPANRGEIVTLYLTGQGHVDGAPPDGEPATGSETTPGNLPRVVIGTEFAEVTYSGLAPTLVGVWIINVRVPQSAAAGQENPVGLQYRDINSVAQTTFRTTILVR